MRPVYHVRGRLSARSPHDGFLFRLDPALGARLWADGRSLLCFLSLRDEGTCPSAGGAGYRRYAIDQRDGDQHIVHDRISRNRRGLCSSSRVRAGIVAHTRRCILARRQPALSPRHNLVTMVCNVPRNNTLAAIQPESAEGAMYWTKYVKGWTAWNHVRTVAALLA